MILKNILDAIGKTPSVKFKRVGSELNCELYGKCEFLNAGGSVKDRIGKNMVEKAESEGHPICPRWQERFCLRLYLRKTSLHSFKNS